MIARVRVYPIKNSSDTNCNTVLQEGQENNICLLLMTCPITKDIPVLTIQMQSLPRLDYDPEVVLHGKLLVGIYHK